MTGCGSIAENGAAGKDEEFGMHHDEQPMQATKARHLTIAILVAGCALALACVLEKPAERPAPAAAESAPGAEAVGPAPRAIARDIEASKTTLRAETRRGSSGNVDVAETRYYVGSALVLVEEIVTSGDSGQSATAYYFDDDRLVFFRGRGTRTIFEPGAEERRERFDIEIGYDLDGNVVDSVKVIDGEPAGLEPLDYEAPKARAEMLLAERADDQV